MYPGEGDTEGVVEMVMAGVMEGPNTLTQLRASVRPAGMITIILVLVETEEEPSGLSPNRKLSLMERLAWKGRPRKQPEQAQGQVEASA
jgi:hypothetical protein